MPAVTAGRAAAGTLARVQEAFAHHNPGCELGWGTLEGETRLEEGEGVLHAWLVEGVGAVLLPPGYHTQEGDGEPLPPAYRPDALEAPAADALRQLAAHRAGLLPGARAAADGILGRFDGRVLRGDIMGEIWRLREAAGDDPAAWGGSEARAPLRYLVDGAAGLGWSTHPAGGWEAVAAGDQLTVTAAAPLQVRGRFSYLWLRVRGVRTTACSSLRRVRYLRDTAGGCAPGFDAFRRLPLTWFSEPGLPAGDGRNVVNSHLVHIAAEQSRTHHHPLVPVGGGKPQCELYLVLDPATFGLHSAGRRAQLVTFPVVGDWERHQTLDLHPGDVVVIPPGTGHRGLDVLANVLTLPGFKPRNELYVDAEIAACGGPHNPAWAAGGGV